MTMLAIHECRRCGGTLNAEHYAEEPHPVYPQVIVNEYCEYCEMVWQSVYDVDADGTRHYDFTMAIDPRRKPVEFAHAVNHIRTLLEVAA
jgi:hypothetical protein